MKWITRIIRRMFSPTPQTSFWETDESILSSLREFSKKLENNEPIEVIDVYKDGRRIKRTVPAAELGTRPSTPEEKGTDTPCH